MVWLGISLDGPPYLRKRTAVKFSDEVLESYVCLFRGALFQQDNSRPHMVRVSQDCLHSVTTLPWPERSPDLSPIVHIWDHLGRRVGLLMSLNELEARLQQIWNVMSQNIIQNLYASIPNRIASCIRARGGSTGSQFSICQRELIPNEEVTNIDTTLRYVATAQSCGTGQGCKKYSCKKMCNGKKRACLKNNKQSNPKCHHGNL
ncbi:transposable element Tcb1 transposase [Trichonephila clavipes]|nr:transposable element Tcb1 transposase [Trichonephila clavipes]